MNKSKGKESNPQIGIFGRRNNGKSTLINTLTGQDIAIVSEHPGTTTDPVKKSIELLGIGPTIMIDTAGIDDTGTLGELKIKKSLQVIKQIDLAILIITNNAFDKYETELISKFDEEAVPCIVIHNKSDIARLEVETVKRISEEYKKDVLEFSALYPKNSEVILQAIRKAIPESAYIRPSLLGDLIDQGDLVLLITPIDDEAPEGRLILPQVQTIRDILDNDCIAIVLKEGEVDAFLKDTKIKPKLAITDSSVFLKADTAIPHDIPLTGFSVLLAKAKGEFNEYLKGTPCISKLENGNRILLLESCTHHVSCSDIGRFKIPKWISDFTGKRLRFDIVSGLDNPTCSINNYSMVIQCGGCMVTRKQLSSRLKPAIDAGIPVSNYGMTIAYVQGIYDRAIEPFLLRKVHPKEDYL
ncbi:[FeFe] hydrogenase H-cluster maturation GTPase HydF [bacterium]|nr:[FeFe] hydrogenase H-cluster maturation GTPase HydF [bacterium]